MYFTWEKSGQRKVGLNAGGKVRAESILNAPDFVYPIIPLLTPISSPNLYIRALCTVEAATFSVIEDCPGL